MSWAHAVTVILAAFLASLVEFVEALTIVLAVGTTRGWRSALIGALKPGSKSQPEPEPDRDRGEQTIRIPRSSLPQPPRRPTPRPDRGDQTVRIRRIQLPQPPHHKRATREGKNTSG